jgi:hypothetical protein
VVMGRISRAEEARLVQQYEQDMDDEGAWEGDPAPAGLEYPELEVKWPDSRGG